MKNFIAKLFIILFILSLTVTFTISSASISYALDRILTWDAPITNADGTPLTDLAGYKIYYGTISGEYKLYKDVKDVITYPISLPDNGRTYYFVVTAYDTSDPANESIYSDEAPPITTPDKTGPGKVSGCSWKSE